MIAIRKLSRLIECAWPLLVLSVAFASADALAAEIRLREALLQNLADRVTFETTASVDQLGKKAHPVEEDCDLHVPLRSAELKIPMLAEVKNGCSMPAGATPVSLRNRIADEIGEDKVTVRGVFRIWLEHPPPKGAVQRQGDPVPAYKNSNPDHQVELHPLIGLGPLDFTGHIAEIRHKSARYGGYGVSELQTLLKKTITVRKLEQTIKGKTEDYIAITGSKMGFNHWVLRGIVRSAPRTLDDGLVFVLDVMDGAKPVKGAGSLPVYSIKATAAQEVVRNLKPGDRVAFQALGRLSAGTILREATAGGGHEIRLPIEFVLLFIRPLNG